MSDNIKSARPTSRRRGAPPKTSGLKIRDMFKHQKQGKMDIQLLLIVITLIVFGVVMVFSASAPYATRTQGNPLYYFERDAIFAVIGFVVMIILSRINYRIYKHFALPILALTLLISLFVFIPGIGIEINGAHRWIGVGEFTIMPSDLVKVSGVIYLSAYLTNRKLRENGTFSVLGHVLFIIFIAILPIYFQPNFSAVIVIAASLFLTYLVGGMNLKHLLIFAVIGAVGAAVAFWPYPGNYRLERLLIVFDPMKDPMHTGWQLLQSLFAVSSGGVFGAGFGHSRQKFDYLADEPHNDFIFAVISEELGFVGAFLLILAFCFLIYRALKATKKSQSAFGHLLGSGLTFIIGIQALINIGVSIGLVPPTGITLPFVSYGGSSLIVMCAIAGILLNISRDEARSRHETN